MMARTSHSLTVAVAAELAPFAVGLSAEWKASADAAVVNKRRSRN